MTGLGVSLYQKGISVGIINIVKTMLQEHLPISLICKCSGLSEEEVRKLAEEPEK